MTAPIATYAPTCNTRNIIFIWFWSTLILPFESPFFWIIHSITFTLMYAMKIVWRHASRQKFIHSKFPLWKIHWTVTRIHFFRHSVMRWTMSIDLRIPQMPEIFNAKFHFVGEIGTNGWIWAKTHVWISRKQLLQTFSLSSRPAKERK